MECKEKAVWVIVPQNEDGIAVCREHVGYALEHLFNRQAVDYGFGYLPEGQSPAYACEGIDAGKSKKKLTALPQV
jgi:hypothetical protein